MALLRSVLLLAIPLLAVSETSPKPADDDYIHPSNGICTDYNIAQEVTSSNSIWALPKFENNFDIAALNFNVTRKDAATTFAPFPTAQNVTRSYGISATFCSLKTKKSGKEKTVLVATHGLLYDRRYWAPSYLPEKYSFVMYALDRGYSVFYYDRVGTGKSEKISGYENQISNQIEILAKLVQDIRNGTYTSTTKASKIVLVGHSFGSFTSNAVLAKYPNIAEGAVLTAPCKKQGTDVRL
ncbi:Alpha/Beta hydrolase protein, partial [Clohesyomyces aquaticus]